MQRIYSDGKADLEKGLEGWTFPRKRMNHRCPQRVIRLLNRVRSDVDDVLQEGRSDKPEGVVRVFAVQEQDSDKLAIERHIADRMASVTGDARWGDSKYPCKTLTLEHHMAARRYGFAEMFAPLYMRSRIQTPLLEGTSPALNSFAKQVLPTVKSMQANNHFEVASIVRKSSPLLSAETLKIDGARQLGLAKAATESLASLFGLDRNPTFRRVLENVAASGLFEVPDALAPFAACDAPSLDVANPDEQQMDEAYAWREMLETSFSQIDAYDQYVSRLSPFGTHQGVKGLEFPRVMVVISDEESRGFLFKYDKLFGIEPLSKTDREHAAAGEETSNDRTRRLFYVTCSRAEESLAIVCYTKAPAMLLNNLVTRGWFDPPEIELLSLP